jgi:hypothetical protein
VRLYNPQNDQLPRQCLLRLQYSFSTAPVGLVNSGGEMIDFLVQSSISMSLRNLQINKEGIGIAKGTWTSKKIEVKTNSEFRIQKQPRIPFSNHVEGIPGISAVN